MMLLLFARVCISLLAFVGVVCCRDYFVDVFRFFLVLCVRHVDFICVRVFLSVVLVCAVLS